MNFTVGEHNYSSAKMPLRTQFHVARRLGTALGPMAKTLIEASRSAVDEGEFGVLMIAEIAKGIGSLSDEDADYVLNACTQCVQREEKEMGWQKIATPEGVMLYQDINLKDMMVISGKVLQENLGSFFLALRQPILPGAAPPLT
jgi:hypothetical protein